MRPRPTTVLALAAAAVLAGGCGASTGGASGDATGGSSSGPGPVQVLASDTACALSSTTAPAGTLTFAVENTGTKVTEFYVLAEGDRILGEVENITPGLRRELRVEITEAGMFTTACKPGMVGDGIRGTFTVTGTAVAIGDTDAKVAKATTDYQKYVAAQSDLLLARTSEFVALVKAGKVVQAKALYAEARAPWERIEPVAESFGDLDPKIDGREDVVAQGLAFTGYHRLERDLWVDGLQPDSSALADQLLADVTEVVTKAKAVKLNALHLANGAKALLDEVATGKITGEEERYSHTDLWDFEANVQGSQAALVALRPVLQERDASLLGTLDARFAALNSLLQEHRSGSGYILYTDLTKDDIKALTVALDAVSEPVSRVAAVVGKG